MRYSYDRTAVTINQASLDKLQKEFRLLTKIYRSIEAKEYPSPKELAEDSARWDEAREIFLRWNNNFRHLMYDVILLQKSDQEDNSPSYELLKKQVWDVYLALSGNTLFPNRYQVGKDWDAFRKTRETNIKRYQVAATKCFKTLDIWLHDRELVREDSEKHLEVAGVNVIILNEQLAGTRAKSIDPYLRGLREKIDIVRRAGFGKGVDGLTAMVNFEKEYDNKLVAAYYRPADDTMTMLAMGLVQPDSGRHRTFTHEIGHRFYYRALPSNARAHWDEVMEARGVKITKDDIEWFTDLVVEKVDRAGAESVRYQEDRYKLILPYIRQDGEKVKFKEISTTPLFTWNGKENVFSPEDYRDMVKDHHEGTSVYIEEISDYANTSPEEAFAECFAIYILDGPRGLKPWTRSFFERICRASGAKMASRYTSVFEGINTGT